MTVRWERRRYSAQEFETAWRASSSYNAVCAHLNLAQTGGVLSSLKSAAEDLGLTRSDMLIPQRAGIAYSGEKVSLETYLRQGVSWSRYGRTIKARLFREGVFEHRCYSCDLDSWQGQSIPLTIDHIDGDNTNNRIENLTPLCWNCHALTPTFGARNRKRSQSPSSTCECGQPKNKRSVRCVSCARRVLSELKDASYPATDVLVRGVEELGYAGYSRTLRLSNTGLKKLLLRRGVADLPQRIKYVYTKD